MNELGEVRTVSVLLETLTGARRALEAARHLYEDRLAPGFTPLEFVGRDELGWSKLIGWLLDPSGSHAQKGRFLHLFTRHVSHVGREWSEAECNNAFVRLEHSSDLGRIDILVVSGERHLIIENKPFAADQVDQLKRYYMYAQGRTRDRAHTTIVYLTSDRKPPSAMSLGAAEVDTRLMDGTLVLSSYPDLAQSASSQTSWLDQCRLTCRSPRVATFIEEIQNQIRADFAGVSNMYESEAIVEVMSRDSQTIKSAFAVQRHFGLLRIALGRQLTAQLASKAAPFGIGVIEKDLTEKGIFLNFEFPGLDPFIVRFYASNIVGLGVLTRNEREMEDPAQIAFGQTLTSRLSVLGKSQNWGLKWPWIILPDSNNGLCPLPVNFWDNADVWAEIADQARGLRSGPGIADTILTSVMKIKQVLDNGLPPHRRKPL
ncbi:MAG: PD-(D/E)XK nuclease family protein [Pseudomonadota bacterium]